MTVKGARDGGTVDEVVAVIFPRKLKVMILGKGFSKACRLLCNRGWWPREIGGKVGESL